MIRGMESDRSSASDGVGRHDERVARVADSDGHVARLMAVGGPTS